MKASPDCSLRGDKTFPTLYKKTQTGAIQSWAIAVEKDDNGQGVIVTTHGQVDGKLQTGRDTVTAGKNVGRANETTALQQAECEAEAKWTKQLKKGYVVTIQAAQAGEVDEVIEGGILPMLAPNKSYPNDPDLQKSIVYPAYFQPKLDGMRCIAIIEDGVCTLWSRTRKRIMTVPHIVKAYEDAFPTGKFLLDGELYNHLFKDEFEELISLLRGDEPDAEGRYLQAEHHVYDCPMIPGDGFGDRNAQVDNIFETVIPIDGPIKRVPTTFVHSFEELLAHYEKALIAGYEGGMARNAAGLYLGKRSKDLQKMKEFATEEFKIVGAEEGRGKDAGTVGAFVCVTKEGGEFKARLKATYARRRELFGDPKQWTNKLLTVRFKRWTSDKIPYLPTGRAIRDYE